MPSSTTELIKGKLDIVDTLRGYLTLTPAGRNFKALCPFHHEKTPSFMISPERQTWHCFGCSLGGDIFSFVMRYENIEFGDAMKMLAEKAGVELRRENPAEYKYSGLLYDLNDFAKNFFKKSLAAAPVAKDYLAKRGLAPQTIEEFELGWAPNEPEALSMHLLNAGNSPQDLMQAGLSIKTERGMMLDRFRGRIMFPIHNHLGKVVGFTGRILPQLDKGDMGKYVNSPETPIFQKSKLIYGYWKSKDAVREKKSAFLVEGQMDFLMSWQSGVKQVIASSGTALTSDHLRTIHRLAEEVVLCFDNDAAGSDAAERAIDLAEANDFAVKVAQFKDFKDAADAAQADPKNVARALAEAIPAPKFYFEKYLPKDPSLLKTREGVHALRVILAKLKGMASAVERGFWMRELSVATGIPESTLQEEAEKATTYTLQAETGKFALQGGEAEMQVHRAAGRNQLIVEELLAAALAKDDFKILDDCVNFFTPKQQEVHHLLATGKRKSEDPGIDEILGLIVLRASGDIPHEEVSALKGELSKEFYRERRKVLTQAIKNAEAKKNEAELKAALAELNSLPNVIQEGQ